MTTAPWNLHERFDWFAAACHSSGGGTRTVTQQSDPWEPAQPYLLDALRAARQEILNQPQQYPAAPGQAVANLNPIQQAALIAQTNRALRGSPVMQAAQRSVGEIASGRAQGQNPGAMALVPFAAGRQLYANPGQVMMTPQAAGSQVGSGPGNYMVPEAAGAIVGTGPASRFVETAEGEFLDPESNRFLEAAYESATDPVVRQYQEAVSPGIDARASRSNRVGSPAWQRMHATAQEELSRSLADMANQMYSGAYERERARQEQAKQNLARIYETQRARQLQAQQNLANIYAQQRARQQRAQESIAQLFANQRQLQYGAGRDLADLYRQQLNQRLQAAQLAPTMANMDWRNIQKLLQAGTIGQEQRQREIDAELQRRLWNLQEPYRRIGQFTQIATGQGSQGGTTTQTQPLYRNTAASVLGGAAMGAGLGGMFSGAGSGAAAGAAAGSAVPVWGPLIGAGVGGLLGLL